MPSPEKFHDTLLEAGVPQDVIERIDEGFPALTSKTKKQIKALYFRQAIDVMERELGRAKTQEIFEANGCCKTGARLKASKAFARMNAALPLEEKLSKIHSAPEMNMGRPELDGHGDLVVHAVSYREGDRYICVCPTISKQAVQPEGTTYCHCCAGHFQFHYEIMLGCKLTVAEISSSPLCSSGAAPCVIRFTMDKT